MHIKPLTLRWQTGDECLCEMHCPAHCERNVSNECAMNVYGCVEPYPEGIHSEEARKPNIALNLFCEPIQVSMLM